MVNFFNKEQQLQHYLKECGELVEEVQDYIRKGVPQSRYVVNISSGTEYWCCHSDEMVVVPEEFVGNWMLSDSCDLRYDAWNTRVILEDEWVRVEQKEIITYEWEEMYND